jgi:GNAT superfamily N-acetyltransferase
MITVRPMQRGEGAALLSMVRALAESHNLTHTVLATPEMYEAAMFSDQPIVGTLLAEYDGVLAGCAVWHRSFSTNRGTEVMYLEDLSVLPEFRRRGIARAIESRGAIGAREKLPKRLLADDGLEQGSQCPLCERGSRD